MDSNSECIFHDLRNFLMIYILVFNKNPSNRIKQRTGISLKSLTYTILHNIL